MKKTAQDDGPPPTFPDHREVYEVLKGRVPGHHNFGQRVCSPVWASRIKLNRNSISRDWSLASNLRNLHLPCLDVPLLQSDVWPIRWRWARILCVDDVQYSHMQHILRTAHSDRRSPANVGKDSLHNTHYKLITFIPTTSDSTSLTRNWKVENVAWQRE